MEKKEAPDTIYLYPYQAKDAEKKDANSDKLVEYIKSDTINKVLDELEYEYEKLIVTYDSELRKENKSNLFFILLCTFIIVADTFIFLIPGIPKSAHIAHTVTLFVCVAAYIVDFIFFNKHNEK